MRFVLGMDANGEVGSRGDYDNEKVIGPFGLNEENSRGQWLKQWATLHDLVLTNTFFSKPIHNRSTFVSSRGKLRQLDYILVDRKTWNTVRDSGSVNELDLGSDHRAVKLRMLLWTKQRKSTNCSKVTKRVRWQNVNADLFAQNLEHTLQDVVTSVKLEEKVAQLEEALLQTAHASVSLSKDLAQRSRDERLHAMIDQRRSLDSRQAKERAELSKTIQKEIKAQKKLQNYNADVQ